MRVMKVILFSLNADLLALWRSKIDYADLYLCARYSKLSFLVKDLGESIVIVDINSIKGEEDKFFDTIKDSNTKVFLTSPNPTLKEGYYFLKYGIKGYANIYISAKNLKNALEIIEDGKTWFYPQFVQKISEVVEKRE